jgi:plasmid stabilization system protein ParE
MPRALVVSVPALADLDHIYDYVSRGGNARAADQAIDEINHVFSLLTEHPQMGRVFRKGGRRPLRLHPHDEYLIFYFESAPLVEIARVVHGKQNIPDIVRDLIG